VRKALKPASVLQIDQKALDLLLGQDPGVRGYAYRAVESASLRCSPRVSSPVASFGGLPPTGHF
jgi:hypothetical protein